MERKHKKGGEQISLVFDVLPHDIIYIAHLQMVSSPCNPCGCCCWIQHLGCFLTTVTYNYASVEGMHEEAVITVGTSWTV